MQEGMKRNVYIVWEKKKKIKSWVLVRWEVGQRLQESEAMISQGGKSQFRKTQRKVRISVAT